MNAPDPHTCWMCKRRRPADKLRPIETPVQDAGSECVDARECWRAAMGGER